jgi:hypothetical protein
MKKTEKEKTKSLEKIEKIFSQKRNYPKKERKSKKTLSETVGKKEKSIEEILEKPKKMKKIVIFCLIFLAVFVLLGTNFYFYLKYKKETSNKSQVQNRQQEKSPTEEEKAKFELNSIKEKIGQFFDLPSDEEPVLATVTDIEKIKGQKFFTKAQNGDKVLIYTQNKKAILFRPGTGKIIEASTILGLDEGKETKNDSDSDENGENKNEELKKEDQTENSEEKKDDPVEVVVYNGSRIKGLAQKIGEEISQISNLEIIEKTNAKGIYDSTLVVDLTGDNGEMVQSIVDTLGAQAGEFPSEEIKPKADILIIGGKN